MRRPSIIIWGFIASVWLHIVAAALVKRLPPRSTKNTVLVAVVEKKKPKKKEEDHKPKDEPKPPEPEPPKIVAPRPLPKPAPKAAEPPPPPVEVPKAAPAPNAFAGTGLAGLPNVGNFSGNGIAVPQGGGGDGSGGDGSSALAGKPKTEAPKEKVLGAAPKDASASGAAGAECAEDVGKPKPTSMPQPTYSDEARAAEVEGVVTIRVMVDESGHVVEAQIVKGLGHGLDERALAAAKSWTFSPGMRCGKPAKSKFVMSMRFALGE